MRTEMQDITADMAPDIKNNNPGIQFREIGTSYIYNSMDISTDYRNAQLFVVDGNIQAFIGNKKYDLQRGDFADIIKQTFRLSHISSDARAFLLLQTDDFMQNLFTQKQPFSPAYMLHTFNYPVKQLKPQDYAIVIRGMEDLHQTITQQVSRFTQDIIRHKTQIFFLEMANLLDKEEARNMPECSNKQKKLFADFINLLETDICHNHTVSYYAKCLHISPQYLRRIVKEVSGDNAYQLISKFLLKEICHLLRGTHLSIQEIADRLHFSDQAVMSKFFKRNKGIPPLKYRNEQR